MAIQLTLGQVKAIIKKSEYSIISETRAGNNLGTVLKLSNGCNINCWDKGTVNCQGKNVDEINKILSELYKHKQQVIKRSLLCMGTIVMLRRSLRLCSEDGI